MRVTALATMALLVCTSVAFAQAGGGAASGAAGSSGIGAGPNGVGAGGAGTAGSGAAGAGIGATGTPRTTQIPSTPGGATSPPSPLPPLNNTKPNEQMQIGPGGSTTGTGGAKH